MPRRRKLDLTSTAVSVLSNAFGVPHPVTKALLTSAHHSNASRTSHYSYLGNPLTVSTVSSRRKKILPTTKAMPYRKPARKTYRRKGNRGRPRRRRLLPALTAPRSKLVRFRVVSHGTLSGATGAIDAFAMKANSLNDPTGALSVALPTSLDQWASFYSKYIVLGSKIRMRVIPTANTGGGIVGIHLADTSSTLTSADHYRSLPNTTQKILTTQKDLVFLSHSYSGKKFWRLNNIKDDSEQEATLSTTPGDPTDIAYYHLYAQDINGGHTFTVEYQVEIEYICLLTDPYQLAVSAL